MAAPHRFRVCTRSTLRWVLTHRALTPWYLIRYWRFLVLRIAHPEVVCEGMVFLDRRVALRARRGYGRLVLGPWVHVGAGTALRAHSGTLRIGPKCVFARDVTVNCHLDIEIGAASLIADHVYVGDFDHRFDTLDVPIKDQGIVTSPVRIGADVWIGTKSTVLRGARIGAGTVVAAHTVVTGSVPAQSIVAGVPGRVVRSRRAGDEQPVPVRRWRPRRVPPDR